MELVIKNNSVETVVDQRFGEGLIKQGNSSKDNRETLGTG